MTRRRKSAANGDGRPVLVRPGVYRVFWTENGKRRSETVKGSAADARAVKAARVAAANAAGGGPVRTLAEYAEHWMRAVVVPDLADNTAANYRTTLDLHVLPLLGDEPLAGLTATACERWLLKLDELGTGGRTKQNAYAILRSCLSHAVRAKELSANPLSAVRKPRHEPEEARPFTEEEQAALVAVADPTRHGPYVRFLLATGCRQGEANGLQWRDLDFEAQRARIERQRSDKGKVSPPKGGRSRTIGITPNTVATLSDLRTRQPAGARFDPEGWVFRVTNGSPYSRRNFGRVWRRLLKDAGIDHRGAHHCRHTYVVRLLDAGVPPHAIIPQTGHRTVTVLLDIYAKWIPAHTDRATAAAAAAFG
ncbi:tyrosine-type recombinase/integrase [Alienimonas sp. DA493]|uniref:tyrosine-type recombinase/integrase n=1 Tax=Alienimonas sp. DA493 TaxID=3373605 RepID=UPI0037547F3F